ncbi:MAG TPA: sugar ABC transporter permease [Solirubrobacteraceae bacterium]|jgi:D-xylose transport system permease protein|nr:sugar ABC transporter permease [Solirubrobacteraceae bacterium]
MSAVAQTPRPPIEDEAGVAPPTATLAQATREWWSGVRNGELGALPIVVGIVAIAIYFQLRNSNFLTAGNFVNLIAQMAATAIIGMGVVFVLLLGEIDLSVGYVSGVAAVISAVLLNHSWPDGPAIVMGLLAGLAIGVLQGFFFAKLRVPSFVVTLAGMLGWNGVLILVIGGAGTIVIQDKIINGLANDYAAPWLSWVVLAAAVGGYVGQQALTVWRRAQAGLPNQPWVLIGLKLAAVTVFCVLAVAWADADRGVPYVGLVLVGLFVFWTFVTNRTRFGRHVYAVGGNAEAARRAGISVTGIRWAVFGIAGLMSAVGGLVLASRLSSVDDSTGGGTILLYSIAAAVIGGTSLFGGRGNIRSAVLGAILISMIDNGLGLINVSAGTKFIVTAIVLLAAVTIDSVARRRSAAAGRT